jgi:ABC-type Zn2+ transport system substrate-binding protein/surface adhesin
VSRGQLVAKWEVGCVEIFVAMHHVASVLNTDASEIVLSPTNMSHNHDHDHGDHTHDHDHDHTHPDTGGPSDNVFMHIDRDNVIALNSIGEGKQVIKPWDERLDERVVSLCAWIIR